MIADSDLNEIKPKPPSATPLASHVQTGLLIPKAARVRFFSPEEWEEFVEEWATSLFPEYNKVRRFGGTGDLGVDVASFADSLGFKGAWDNYQCKRYDHPLSPSDIWVEIGKIIYYCHLKEYAPPRNQFFICSMGIGTKLERLLNDPEKLKIQARLNWEKHCKNGITETAEIPLEAELLSHFDNFDFSIFKSKSVLELIEGHSKTGYHAIRFGGGLPYRPSPGTPPNTPLPNESRYIRQLLDAYGSHLGQGLGCPADLSCSTSLTKDYLRQRERFYHAESLRNFARDNVPEGTFADLQNEIYQAVIDTCENKHVNGYERMKATLSQSTLVSLTANPLSTATKVQDRQGICHQLANDDRLTWVPQDE